MLSDGEWRGPAEGPVRGLAYNSKTIEKGQLFFCLRGFKEDGHNFAAEAVARGAAALVVEEFLPLAVPQVKVADARGSMARVGRCYYGDPAARLGMIGVTGTNGKTTTSFYIRSILEQLGRPVGLVGTVFNQFAGEPIPSQLTTPESIDLMKLLVQAGQDGCPWVVSEVSSHALALGRVDPADFDLAVFLNIARDHFEFHQDYEHYFASKARLIREMSPEPKGSRPRACVLNADDPQVMRLAAEAPVPVITFGIAQPADLRATDLESGLSGSRFRLHLPGATPVRVELPMPGAFNVANALAAAAVGWQAGVDLAGIVRGLESCRCVPGRVERIDEGQPFTVLVDFAHNPAALAQLVSLRPEGEGRTILVFGAEGGKDRGKRPGMGAAASRADLAIITSDNMHDEDPLDVARQIAAGLGQTPCEIIPDRRQAIARGVALAQPGDLLIIAGKGHEQTWVWEGRRQPFDDRLVVRELLRERLSVEKGAGVGEVHGGDS